MEAVAKDDPSPAKVSQIWSEISDRSSKFQVSEQLGYMVSKNFVVDGGYSHSLLACAEASGVSPEVMLRLQKSVKTKIRPVDDTFRLTQSIVARGGLPRDDTGRVFRPALRKHLGMANP